MSAVPSFAGRDVVPTILALAVRPIEIGGEDVGLGFVQRANEMPEGARSERVKFMLLAGIALELHHAVASETSPAGIISVPSPRARRRPVQRHLFATGRPF